MVKGEVDESAAGLITGDAQSIIIDHHCEAGRHLVIETGGVRHRLLVIRPDCLQYNGFLLPDDAVLQARMAALSSFHRWQHSRGSFAPPRYLRPTGYQRLRLDQMLQVLDLLVPDSGKHLGLRSLAKQILRVDAKNDRAIDWKTSSTRRQVQRLIAGARRLANDGYRELLACRMPKYQ